ncbi:MAG: phage terminase large subunit family protein [Planctomycetaceae bacterium]|nr:phage terminase large subunit family protein [Planctomycetaceae bacterium]
MNNKINPQSLKPAALMRLLNTAGFGMVLTEHRLRRHRNRAGFAIGTEKEINLFKYAAWLTHEFFREKPQAMDYLEKKRQANLKSMAAVRAAQDIGELPEVVNPERKIVSLHSFKTFCETYFAEIFYLHWSEDHIRVIEKIERAVRQGGLFAMAMPRGAGKSCLCQVAVLWAALDGAAPFICLIAASAERAQNLLENIKTWLETNTLLHEDFPEVCFPVKCLERIANRQKGQKYLGEPTRIEWSADKIVLPTITNSKASGVVITSSGMHGSDIRGQQHARPDGRVERPSLVLIDDPQTTESAWSRSQSERREAILGGDVLGMAGPGKKIAGLMACTVIRPGDMASKMLDREKHPDWQGERTKLIYSFPANETLWSKYAELRSDSLRNDGDGSIATEFYRDHRLAMDAGAVVAWPQRFNPDELSAIQHAMNLKLRDEIAFYSEFQNEPKVEDLGDEMLTIEEIAEKTNGHNRGIVPQDCQHLTMFIDVHQNALYWMIVAWEPNFTGYIVDYGTWPDQHREYFTLRDCRMTIQHVTGGAGLEASTYSALEKLADARLAVPYYRNDGMELRIERCLIDAGWGQTSDVVYQFCRQSKQAAILFPSHGQYVGASSVPFSEHKRQKGDRIGRHWRIPGSFGSRGCRHILIDTNYWKTFVHARLGILMGDPGCLSLFGHDPKRHQLLAEHLTAEYRVRTMAFARTVDEWKVRASRPDNHWLDCLVGCAVGASIQGAELATFQGKQVITRTRIKLSELQRTGRRT